MRIQTEHIRPPSRWKMEASGSRGLRFEWSSIDHRRVKAEEVCHQQGFSCASCGGKFSRLLPSVTGSLKKIDGSLRSDQCGGERQRERGSWWMFLYISMADVYVYVYTVVQCTCVCRFFSRFLLTETYFSPLLTYISKILSYYYFHGHIDIYRL